ncbi:MAG TPA: ABC-type transport auxiliary lipoprotein family protein [Caulobacteraceae bacterium]|nr:ABC-type transport auxiliary lipoprotein family protein [Caulobacteraceae bacterium]
MIRSRLVLPALLTLSLGLAGCISLLPAAKPVQLYRFGPASPAPAAPAQAGLAVSKGGITFQPAAAGDSLLTVTGQEAAFISNARWVEPASVMFDEALTAAFDAPGAPRLVGLGAGAGGPSTLRLEVRRFQTDYDQGASAAPTVDVAINAVLIRNHDRSFVAQKLFEVRQPAAENRVTAIVAAYDSAVGQAVAGVRDWTAVTAAPIKP